MTKHPDHALLERCLAGERRAWDAFVARFAPPMALACRSALARTGRPSGTQEVADALQEVFLLLLKDGGRALRLWRGEASLGGYLSLLAARHTLKGRRQDMVPLPATLPAPVAPDRDLEALRAGMEGLAERARLALLLQAEGASAREVGAALGLSEDAAAQVLSRARAEIRKSAIGRQPD